MALYVYELRILFEMDIRPNGIMKLLVEKKKTFKPFIICVRDHRDYHDDVQN